MPNIQDLSADFYVEDDQIGIEEAKKAKRKSRRNWIVGLSITAVLLVGLALIYYFLATDWLADYRTIPFLTFRYTNDDDTAVITSLNIGQPGDKKTYPENFKIPEKINGRTIIGIEDQAFMGATRLKKVTMPDTITYIGDECFYGCSSLETIEFSSSLTSIGVDAFYNTKYLANLPSDDYTVVNDILVNVGIDFFNYNTILVNSQSKGDELLKDSRYKDCEVRLFSELPQLHYWLDGLFRNNDRLVYVEMPDYLETVPTRSFQGCTNLVGIDFPDDVTAVGDYAFAECSNLVDATVPSNIVSIGDYAFKDTSADISDISHLESVGVGAFQNCMGVTEVTYPAIQTIPNYCFDGCENLTKVDFINESSIHSIGNSAFQNTGLKTFTVPHGVTYLINNIFNGCEDLTSVALYNNTKDTTHTITTTRTYEDEDGNVVEQIIESVYTDGVATIYSNAFSGCTSLENISLYDYNDAKTAFEVVSGTDAEGSFNMPITFTQSRMNDDSYIFRNTGVKVANLSSDLERIGNYAFDGCTNLEAVNFPTTTVNSDDGEEVTMADSVLERVSERAFQNCTSFKGFNYLPSTLSYIGAYSFYNCTSLESMDMSGTVVSYIYNYAFGGDTALKDVQFSRYTTAMNTGAFDGCTSLESVIIPVELRSMQEGTFANENAVEGEHDDNLVIYYEATQETVQTSTYLSDGWFDDTCDLYTYSEEEPEPFYDADGNLTNAPAYAGYWHYGEDGNPEVWDTSDWPETGDPTVVEGEGEGE